MDAELLTKRKLTLSEILFIPFFETLQDDKYERLNITEEEFDELSVEYFGVSNTKTDIISQQLQRISVQISIFKSCAGILLENGYDKDLIELLENNELDLYPDNVDEIINALFRKAERLESKFKVLKSQQPKQPKDENLTAYDILANLSLGLEMKLDFQATTVMDYLSYTKALDRKNKAFKAQQNKKK